MMRTTVAAIALVVLAVVAPPAYSQLGTGYGAAPINDHPNANPVNDDLGQRETVPALPGYQHAFWAGTCDMGTAPGLGENIEGGIGSRPDTVLAGTGRDPAPPNILNPAGTHAQAPVPAPANPEHCIDWGAPGIYKGQSQIWQHFPYTWHTATPFIRDSTDPERDDFTPSWRLAPATQAGSHVDGTSLLQWARDPDVGAPGFLPRDPDVGRKEVDGAPDNVRVDLPPGFVANPQAVPQCTADQFDTKPLACPPESQIGVLRLNIQVVGLGDPNIGGGNVGSNDTAVPIYNLEPRKGKVAEIGFGHVGYSNLVTVRLVAQVRTDGDFGVTGFVGQIPAALAPIGQQITLWGVPWAASNDIWRHRDDRVPRDTSCRLQPGGATNNYMPWSGLAPECRASYDPEWGPIKPFVTTETDCNPAPVARLQTDTYHFPGAFTGGNPATPAYPWPYPASANEETNWKTYLSVSPPVTGCADLPFEPQIAFSPTTSAADGATGLDVDLSIPQNNDPPPAVANDPGRQMDDPAYDPTEGAPGHWRSQAGLATAHLKDSVVALPPGVAVNPSAATGLQGCSDGQIGVRGFDAANGRLLFNNGDPFNKDGGADGAECPDGSRIGTALVDTPLLAEPLTGEVILGEPKSTNPQSGDMFRMFIVVRDPERGLIGKIFGSAVANPTTGQLTATFRNNPEVPFEDLRLRLRGGQQGLLAMPPRCGSPGWSATFTPWSAAHGGGGQNASDGGAFAVNANCGFGFAPGMTGGMSVSDGRASGAFTLRLNRPEGQQTLRGLSVALPPGLLAVVRDVPLCTNAQAAANACPAASRIGTVDGAAGSGAPFVLERKGDVFLTEGYKGAPYGLSVVVPVEAGPFRGPLALSPITVRQALHVDRRTLQVTAVSDPLPQIHHGIPLRVRQVVATINRGGFMRNPSGCAAKQVAASMSSPQGANANATTPFQATRCARLPFRPRLALRLVGRKQVRTGRHPGVRAKVAQKGTREAGIRRAVVRLPKSLALDPENAQALCEFADGTRADPENHCPRGSIVGRARAVSPLLRRPLVGNVFFVKNIRIDPQTGNEIRTLPMIVVALRGEVAVNLVGESSTTKSGKLVNTFGDVPDAPITRFNLNIKGGKNGILAVTRTHRARINLCDRPRRHIAEADMDGQNGRRHDFNVRMKTPCRKRRASAAEVCRKRTESKRAFRRCVTKVKRNRAQAKRAAKRKAARRTAARRQR